MSVAAFLFRFRVAVMVLLHLAGFFAPLPSFTGANHGTLWLAASTLVSRTGWFNLAAATQAVTLLGLACLVAGSALRVWGTAYLGSYIMRETAMQGQRLVTAGPYAYLRNPLYLGAWSIAVATSLLMPLAGACLFLAAYSGFLLFLIVAEERFLAAQLGEPYLQYRRNVPCLLPRLAGHLAGSLMQPDWRRALLNETYPIGFTICFAIFAWRYNARILIRCLLICYGFSLILRALNETAMDTTPSSPSSPRR